MMECGEELEGLRESGAISTRLVASLDDLSHDREGNFLRRISTDVQANRRVERRQLSLGHSCLEQALAPLGLCGLAAEGAHIERRADKRDLQGWVIQFWIVRERGNGGGARDLHLAESVLGPGLDQLINVRETV